MLTKLKDTDRLILSMLDDKDLLSACLADKNTNALCDETFFRNRLYEKYPNLVPFKSSNVNWKKFYLENVYYIDKLKEYKFQFTKQSNGTPKQYYEIISDKPIKRVLLLKIDHIIKNKFYDLLDFYLLFVGSSREARYTIYYYLSSNGAVEYFNKMWNEYRDTFAPDYKVAKAAVRRNQFRMLDFMISRGIVPKEIVLNIAVTTNRPEVEDYIREKFY